ncbi:MAG: hypothetical protein CENE_00487 [Candidatus Celerinatantimonas neptuna]|nr:MAG: hypothetical protein CENE_00487 [Candidatus Celerinatantimonas neptuna]
MRFIQWGIWFLLWLSGSVYAASPGPVVHFQQTTVQGIYQGQVAAFLGIPYAQAPVGKLRWQLPKKILAYGPQLDATKMGTVCPQFQNGKFIGKENCLNLNIYRPKANHLLPVLVYIHGGNNQAGKAQEFNPIDLAKSLNAVIVMINYRLGVLGFNPMKAIKTNNPIQSSGNFGLLDQAAALDWVHTNIRQFGGCSDQVTVAGFSAGGRDVMAMLISPVFKGKFQHAIVFSGGMTTAGMSQSQQVFLNAFAPLVVKEHIKANLAEAKAWLRQGGHSIRHYLQQMDAKHLAGLMRNAGIRMSAFPHLYRDGYVLPKVGFNTTRFNSVPVMMLSGENEFSIFALTSHYFSKAFHDGSLAKTPALLQQYQFVFHYGGQLYSLFNVQLSAQRMYSHYLAPIYGTEVQFGTDPYVSGHKMALLGSFHGVFMPLLDKMRYQRFIGNAFQKPGAIDLSYTFRRYLFHFIRSGNPNGKGLPQWLRWTPQHNRQGKALLMLNANLHRALIYMSSKTYDQHDVMNAIKQDHHLSESVKYQLINQVLNGRWFSSLLDKTFHNPSLWPSSVKGQR